MTGDVLRTLAAHPHTDTPAEIARLTGLRMDQVATALADLRDQGLTHTDGMHHQVTPLGFRAMRAAA